ATCTGGGCLTRHSHYARIRLGGLTIWRIQCTSCQAVFTVLPPFRLTLSAHEPGGGPPSPDCHPWRPQSGMVCHHLPYLSYGPLSLDLCPGAPQPGDRAGQVSFAAASVYPGR